MIQALLFLSFFYTINIYAINHFEKPSPELHRAILKLKEIFPMKESYAYNYQDHSIKNSISYHQKKIKIRDVHAIPNTNWNQSKKSTKINYNKYVVNIKKYNIRKKNPCVLKNVYKMWKYEVYENNYFVCAIFWTEKGQEDSTAPITLHDLRFLKPFMPPEVAQRIFGTM